MSVDYAVWVGQTALFTALLLASPPLFAALLVGTLVSVLQTVTQVQEVTLSFIPKMFAVAVVLAMMGGWMMQMAVGFGTTMFQDIPVESGSP